MEKIMISMAAARVNACMSQAEAAEKLGISKVSLGMYETGKRVPSFLVVQKMGEVYQFPWENIFFGKRFTKC